MRWGINRICYGLTGWLLTALISVNAHAAVSLLRQSATITSIDDTANGVVSVTLSGNFPNNNLKVGQKIAISGTTNYNGTFTIISVTDQSHFTYEDASKTNSTAAEATGTAGGHYSDFTSWEDQNRNLTSGAGDTEVLECYNDWESGYGMTSNLTVSGWVTGAANNISITVPPTERHNGTPGSGFRLEFGAGVEIVLDQPNLYITFDGIEIDGNGAGGRFNFPSNANMNPTIKNCIIHDISGSAFFIRVIGTLHAYNNVIYSISGNAFNFYTTGAGYHYIYNNTIYG